MISWALFLETTGDSLRILYYLIAFMLTLLLRAQKKSYWKKALTISLQTYPCGSFSTALFCYSTSLVGTDALRSYHTGGNKKRNPLTSKTRTLKTSIILVTLDFTANCEMRSECASKSSQSWNKSSSHRSETIALYGSNCSLFSMSYILSKDTRIWTHTYGEKRKPLPISAVKITLKYIYRGFKILILMMFIAKQPSFLTEHFFRHSHDWLVELIVWFREKCEAKSSVFCS